MEPIEVQRVRDIFNSELAPALEERIGKMLARKGLEIEENVTTAALALHEEIRAEVRKDHAENRTRLQGIYDKAAESIGQGEAILAGQKAQDSRAIEMKFKTDYLYGENGAVASLQRTVNGLQSEFRTVIGEIRGWAGVRQGEQAAEARFAEREAESSDRRDKKKHLWLEVLKWTASVGGIGSLVNWMKDHHWGMK